MTVKSASYSDVLTLSRSVFLRVFDDPTCPDFRISIARHSPATKDLRGWALISAPLSYLAVRACI